MSQNVAVVKVDDEDDGFITFEGPEGFRVTVDLYDTHNDFVMLRRKHLNEENPNAYHNAISDYFAKMGFPKPATRKADKLDLMYGAVRFTVLEANGQNYRREADRRDWSAPITATR